MKTVLKIALGIIIAFTVMGVGCAILLGAAVNHVAKEPIVSGQAGDVQVSVQGDTGVAFSGDIGTLASERTISGYVEMGGTSYVLSGINSSGIFTAVIQKQSGDGSALEVDLYGCPDGAAHNARTTAPYGAVTVSCN